LAEVVNGLYKAKNRNYLPEDIFSKYYKQSFDLMNMMIAFKNQIK